MHLYRETPHHQGPTLFVDMNVLNRTAIEVKVEVSSHIHTFVSCDETSQGHAISRLVDMPYTAKFSRHISFAVFADWSQTAKIKLANFSILSSGQRLSLDSELYHHAAKTWSTHFGTWPIVSPLPRRRDPCGSQALSYTEVTVPR